VRSLRTGKYYDSNRNNQSLTNFIYSLYTQRELIVLLISGDLKARYRKSYIGLLWTLINPILSSLVLWFIFVSIFKSRLADGTQYAPYLLAGILLITFFNQGLLQGAESISNGTRLFLKIRVDPRIFCISNVISNAVNFFFGLIALVIVSLISEAAISNKIPLVLVVGVCLSLLIVGLGLILSIMFIRFDDSKYIVTFLIQLLTYMTPVFYPKDMLSSYMKTLISLNPLTSYLEVFRHVFNGTEIATSLDWGYMIASSIGAFILGALAFRKYWLSTIVML